VCPLKSPSFECCVNHYNKKFEINEHEGANVAFRSGLKDIGTVGIPRALLYYRYGVFWKRFFEELGVNVVVSDKTDKATLDAGDALSIDECCLASKVYMGHVAQLVKNPSVDSVFVPCFASADHRGGFCTKFQSLPDLVRATFRDQNLRVISLLVDEVTSEKKTRAAWVEFGRQLGAGRKDAQAAAKAAWGAWEADVAKKARDQRETFRLIGQFDRVVARDVTGREAPPMVILLVAHPYISHDEYISGYIAEAFERMGALVVFADEAAPDACLKKSFEFSETMPWVVNRHLAGAILEYQDKVDGIVLLSAFPCGPDSMFDDAVIRKITDVPILNLMIDAQSGSAGVETRIESFCDILKFQRKGSYFND
jgi:predicted nucleotide-binding protein (sugar kinase/HSP70/actin superfamily)